MSGNENLHPLIFGHRGACGYEYENTIPSFKKAIEQGADGLETDVWLLSDGNIVLHHDKAVKDTNQDGPINISKMTLEELKKIELPNGSKIPTIQEFLEEFSKVSSKAGVLIKFSIDLQDLKVGAVLIPILSEYGVLDRTYLCANMAMGMKKVRKVNSDVMLIASNQLSVISDEKLIPDGKYGKLNITAFNLKFDEFKPELVDILTRNNLLCFIWDLNTEENLKKYMVYKPFAIYTDYPDLAVKIKEAMNK